MLRYFIAMNDNVLYVRKLSLRKVLNLGLLFFSYLFSVFLRRPVMWGKPAALSIEPTTKCNLHCPECVSGLRAFTRPEGAIHFDLYSKIILENYKNLTWLNLYFQGEPFLHPQWFKLIQLSHNKGIFTVTSTNAHYLSERVCNQILESGLDKLIVSVDGASQESYAKYRIGGSLKVVTKGIRLLAEMKKKQERNTPFIEMQFVVFAHNEHEMDEMKKLAADLGVDAFKIKTAQIHQVEQKPHLIPRNSAFSRYLKTHAGEWKIKSNLQNRCWRMWHSAVITHDGRMIPCCFDKNAEHTLGHLNPDTTYQTWGNSAYQKFRTKILTDRKSVEMCRNCTEGLRMRIGDG